MSKLISRIYLQGCVYVCVKGRKGRGQFYRSSQKKSNKFCLWTPSSNFSTPTTDFPLLFPRRIYTFYHSILKVIHCFLKQILKVKSEFLKHVDPAHFISNPHPIQDFFENTITHGRVTSFSSNFLSVEWGWKAQILKSYEIRYLQINDRMRVTSMFCWKKKHA